MNLQTATSSVSSWTPAVAQAPSFEDKCQSVIDVIAGAMHKVSVTTIACSYGKDSSAVLALTLQAARQLKAAGHNAKIRIITSDTLVENPAQTKLNITMSARALNFAREHGLDVDQIWVTPNPIEHYLVSMLGGRGIASVAGSDATCSVELKIKPMNAVRRMLAKTYKAENIITLIGTRFEESSNRGNAMRKRGESATKPLVTDTGSLQLSPIADWSEADVWRLLNGAERQTGFRSLGFEPTIAFYEVMGDASCGTVPLGQSEKSAKSPCSGGRGGCWTCQKVSADHSLENMLDQFPAFEPLVRLSKAIRAGHLVPANRSFLAKSADSDGRIRVFSNAYSPSWCSQLLKWVMTIDANEDDRAMARTQKLGRPVARRFPRLLEPEHEMLIMFQWARYGVQKPGEYIRIREAIMGGKRWALPSDEQLEALEAKSDKKLMGKTIGYLQSNHVEHGKPVFTDNWRDLIGTESGCTPEIMLDDNGERAMYRNSAGQLHDTIEVSDFIECDLSELRDPDGSLGITYEDFMWWLAMEFADGEKSSNEEMNFLLREGVIRARNGYQSTLATYQRYNRVLGALREQGRIDSLEAIKVHPAFTANLKAEKPSARAQKAASTASKQAPQIIATDAEPATPKTTTKPAPTAEAETQLDLFAA